MVHSDPEYYRKHASSHWSGVVPPVIFDWAEAAPASRQLTVGCHHPLPLLPDLVQLMALGVEGVHTLNNQTKDTCDANE